MTRRAKFIILLDYFGSEMAVSFVSVYMSESARF